MANVVPDAREQEHQHVRGGQEIVHLRALQEEEQGLRELAGVQEVVVADLTVQAPGPQEESGENLQVHVQCLHHPEVHEQVHQHAHEGERLVAVQAGILVLQTVAWERAGQRQEGPAGKSCWGHCAACATR